MKLRVWASLDKKEFDWLFDKAQSKSETMSQTASAILTDAIKERMAINAKGQTKARKTSVKQS